MLYVGKAKSIRKRIISYARQAGHTARIMRMIAATASIEFVSTATETEALLLEANLIKRLRPRFNVLMRDDKSFPYILITAGETPPMIAKHRGARSKPGEYYGPFASAQAVHRTITALERAFLIRSCSDTVYESRTRPCLLHQIKRCAAPCTGEISHTDYAELVREAKAFLSGKSRAVKEELAGEMEKASHALDFERAAVYRDRLAALSAVQSRQGINPRTVEEADVFAVHQQGGYSCVEVFFFRTGQNWGNRAYFPRADRSLEAGRGARRVPRAVLRRQAAAALHLPLARDRGSRAARRGADASRAATRSRSRCRSAARRRSWSIMRSPTRARRWGASSPRRSRSRICSSALGETFGLRKAAAPHRGLRQQPHPGHATRSAR